MSFWLNAKRVARYGVAGFVRNGFISLAAIVILSITLFVLASIMIAGAALSHTLEELTNKVDVTVYFSTGATENQVFEVRSSLQALPEVASVEYVSRDQALADFRSRHQNDPLTMQALDELGENPLGAALEVRAKETSQYEAIAKYLSSQQEAAAGAGAMIEKVNFYQNKTAIDRLTNIIDASQTAGLILAIIFGAASVLIAFNTIRLAIYTARDEIGVMNLVGASRWYVRGPFMIAGVLYGLAAALIVLLVLYPIVIWLGPPSEKFLGTFNVFDYFTSQFPLIFLLVVAAGVSLGALSSFLAVRRYLK
jgi:cell division transport system permease protein